MSMIITVLNEGRRTMTKRTTGAKHWSVNRGQRLTIIEDGDTAIITLNSNHQILDTWFYHETEVSQEKELYIRVRVGRPEKKKKVQDAEGSEFDLHVWAKPETEYTSALYTISIVGGRAVSIDTPIDDTLQNIKELLEEPNNQR